MNDRNITDPIVRETRRIRDEHARRFHYDLDAICEDYMARQIEEGDRLVRLYPNERVTKMQAVSPGDGRAAG